MGEAFAVKAVAGLVAVVAVVVLVGRGLDRWRTMETAHACVAALEAGDLAGADARCPKRLPADARQAAAGRVCDSGLADPKGGGFAVRQTCSALVKQVVAERDAARDQVVDLTGQLTAERAAHGAALVRAEARARTDERNKANAEAALNAAPRTAAGAVVCDAGCLRALTGG